MQQRSSKSFLRGRASGALNLAFALASFAAGAASLFRAIRAWRLVGSLETESADTDSGVTLQKLSVIVPARNEEKHLTEALGSVVNQDYPGELEAVLVDDRSDDATPEIGDRMAQEHERLRTLHVTELPEGWLGKNHAAGLGATRTDGEWLLFCDADVVFDAATFRRAVEYAEREALDHLTLVPRLELDGYWLRSVTAFSWMMGLVHVGLYRANVEGSGVGVGIGAFNLLRRGAYEKIGTHESLRLEVVDDLALGKFVKETGLRGRMLFAQSLARVRWHESAGSFLRGIENTVYSGVDFAPAKAAGYVGAVSALLAWPFLGSVSRRGPARALCQGAVVCNLGSFLLANAYLGREVWRLAPSYPVAALMVCGILIRSTIVAEHRGGLVWRDTFYPLDTLRNRQRIG